MKLFSRGRPRLSVVAKPRLGDRDQHAAKQATKQPRNLEPNELGSTGLGAAAAASNQARWRLKGGEKGSVSTLLLHRRVPASKFSASLPWQGGTSLFSPRSTTEQQPRNRRATTKGGSMNAGGRGKGRRGWVSFVYETRSFSARKCSSGSNLSDTRRAHDPPSFLLLSSSTCTFLHL